MLGFKSTLELASSAVTLDLRWPNNWKFRKKSRQQPQLKNKENK